MSPPGLPLTLAAFVLVIGVLVFVHEFGHYAAARMLGIRVETFAIGFGREIAGWTDRHGTRWKLGWLPLGGYAKFAGDMNAASLPDPDADPADPAERAGMFQFRPLWQRALVVVAGPAVNFLFAIFIFAAFFLAVGQQYTPPVAGQVLAGSPAAAAGLRPGDRFVEVGKRPVDRFEEVMRIVAINPGQPLEIIVARDGRRVHVVATPKVVRETDRFGNVYRRGMLGVASGPPALAHPGPVAALGAAVEETAATVAMMGDTLGQIVTGRRAIEDLGGPIRIAQYSGQSASLGPAALVSFIALISINLGFINLLPIPMLDGGHLLLYALEAVRRRPLDPRVREWAFMSGFALILSLMLVLTWNDLASVGLWQKLARIAG